MLFDLKYASGKGDPDEQIEVSTIEDLMELARPHGVLFEVWAKTPAYDKTYGEITIADDYLEQG